MIDELIATDPGSLSPVALGDHVTELEQAVSAVQTARDRALGELDARDAYREDAALAPGAWLRQRCGTATRDARARVRVARRLRSMPETSAALETGDISHDQAVLLARCAGGRTAEAFVRDESLLVDAARRLDCDQLRIALKHWEAMADPDGATADEAARWDRRHAGMAQGYDGTWSVFGLLDDESGVVVHGVWADLVNELWRADQADDVAPDRTTPQRWVDALVEMARRAAACDPETDRPPRPEMVGISDVDALFGDDVDDDADASTLDDDPDSSDAGGPAPGTSKGAAAAAVDLLDGIVLSGEAARRLACDATWRRVVVSGASEIIDMGRATPVPNASQRRGLVLRDGECLWPGCDRPPNWCDAHHLEPYRRGDDIGGPTDLEVLGLVCRRHHRLVHEGGFTLARDPTTSEITLHRPDGTLAANLAPAGPLARRRAITHPRAPDRHRRRRKHMDHQAELARARVRELIRSTRGQSAANGSVA